MCYHIIDWSHSFKDERADEIIKNIVEEIVGINDFGYLGETNSSCDDCENNCWGIEHGDIDEDNFHFYFPDKTFEELEDEESMPFSIRVYKCYECGRIEVLVGN